MAIKGSLTQGLHVTIKFVAAHNNSRHTHVITDFKEDVNQSRQMEIRQGADDEINYDVLPDAGRLFIRVTLPRSGSGQLTVIEGTTEIDSEMIKSNTQWTYVITTEPPNQLLASSEEE